MPRERRGGKVNDPIPIRSWSGGGSASSGAAIPVYAQTKSTSMPADPESNPTPDGAPTMSEQRGELVGFEDKSNWLARMGRALRGEASMADQMNSQLALGTQASLEARALQGDRLKAELENLREQKAHAERLQQQLIASNLELEDRRGRWGSTAIAERGTEDRLTAAQKLSADKTLAGQKGWLDFAAKNNLDPDDVEQRTLFNEQQRIEQADALRFLKSAVGQPQYDAARRAGREAMFAEPYLKTYGTVKLGDGSVAVPGFPGSTAVKAGIYTPGRTDKVPDPSGLGTIDQYVDPNFVPTPPTPIMQAAPPVGSTAMSADSDVPPVDQRFSVVEPAKPQSTERPGLIGGIEDAGSTALNTIKKVLTGQPLLSESKINWLADFLYGNRAPVGPIPSPPSAGKYGRYGGF